MIATIKKLSKNIYKFYRFDCCWPYSVSFYLVLIIFYLEACVIKNPSKWASIVSYGILLAYYLYIRKLYAERRLTQKRNESFLMLFLTAKIIIWGCILVRIALL
ncbi:MAG: hypothetical protein JW938_04055 [Candidatus Omnitrophica bacterium]|nr:hypothetical protein [Candidatus Omnitrophota bacterium]